MNINQRKIVVFVENFENTVQKPCSFKGIIQKSLSHENGSLVLVYCTRGFRNVYVTFTRAVAVSHPIFKC